MPGIDAVNCNVNHRSRVLALSTLVDLYLQFVHQPGVACANRPAVDLGFHTFSGDLRNSGNLAVVFFRRICPTQSFCDRMRGKALDMGGKMQEFLLSNQLRMDGRHLEHSFGKGSCLIEHDSMQA